MKSNEKPLVSVVIPTFNRPSQLRRSLVRLLHQGRPNLELIIIDNCSDFPAQEIVDDVLGASDWRLTVVRNELNIGMSGNILRCFEKARGAWLWILGDDDEVEADAIDKIVTAVESNLQAISISFKYELFFLRGEKDEAKKLEDLFEFPQDFPGLIFLSSTVYRLDVVQKFVRVGYEFCHTYAPHSAILLAALRGRRDAEMVFSAEKIVRWRPPPDNEKYSVFFGVKICGLIDLVPNHLVQDARRSLLTQLSPVRRLFVQAMRDCHDGYSCSQLRSFFMQYTETISKFDDAVTTPVRIGLWRFLFLVSSASSKYVFPAMEKIYLLVRGRRLRDSLPAKRVLSDLMVRASED